MALDGIFLSAINLELQSWINSRVDRVWQISKFEVVLILRKPGQRAGVLFSASGGSARVNFTKRVFNRMKNMAPFCVLLRKYLTGSRLISTKQLGFDRVLFLNFDGRNEIGDLKHYVLVIEIMGKHSNIILFDRITGLIIDAIKKENYSYEKLNKIRRIQPRAVYKVFNLQNKLNIVTSSLRKLFLAVSSHSNLHLSSAILKTIEGVSPVVARELAFGLDEKILVDFDEHEKEEVFKILQSFQTRVIEKNFDYVVFIEEKTPKEFCWFKLNQFGNLLSQKNFDSASEALEFFYDEKLKLERINQTCFNVVKIIKREIEKVRNKKEVRLNEFSASENFDHYRKYADLLAANMHKIKKGDEKVEVVNFYDGYKKLIINLNVEKTPIQNVQYFYKIYKKSRNARTFLKKLISDCDEEIKFLENELDVVLRASSENDVLSVVSDLEKFGFLKNVHGKRLSKKDSSYKDSSYKVQFLKYMSTDGFEILCGRNSKQNDYLTFKKAEKTDLWLHVQNYSGSHVLVLTKGRKVSDQVIVEAAKIAVYNSSVRNSNGVGVDYTLVKNVKKVSSGMPGMVIFKNNKTVYVDSDVELVKRLKID